VSFAAITLCVASVVVAVCFVIGSSFRKVLDTPLYEVKGKVKVVPVL